MRIALCGAAVGAVYELIGEGGGYLWAGEIGPGIGLTLGGAIGGAALFATVSGVRNLLILR
jgi:hypothetical protein